MRFTSAAGGAGLPAFAAEGGHVDLAGNGEAAQRRDLLPPLQGDGGKSLSARLSWKGGGHRERTILPVELLVKSGDKKRVQPLPPFPSLHEALADAERDYWSLLASRTTNKEAAAAVAGVSLATFYRRALGFFIPKAPRSETIDYEPEAIARFHLPRPLPIILQAPRAMPLVLRSFRAPSTSNTWLLLGAFGVRMTQDGWRRVRRRRSVRELERLYEEARSHYRIYLRRAHPDGGGANGDAREITEWWTKLRRALREEMRKLGAEF